MLSLSRRGVPYALAATILAAAPSPAGAAGFAIFEQGAKGMGFAGAFTAQSDPASIFHNAAGIAFLKGKHIHIGATLISPSSDFLGDAPYPGPVSETGDPGVSIPPVFDYTHQASERMVLGLGLHVPFGLATEWTNPASYSGRFISRRAELSCFSLNPTLAYRVEDRLAVGVGLDLRFSSVSLTRNVPVVNPFTLRAVDAATVELDSDTATGIGFNLGVLARPSDALSFGLSYRHKVKVEYEGQANFERIPTGNTQLDVLVGQALPLGDTPVETAITFPAIVAAGVAYTTGDWTVEGDVNWYQWSTFDTLPLTFTDYPALSGDIEENYDSSFQYRVGLEYRVSEAWSVRGGYFFDESPAPAESVGPLLPDADRHGAALGFGWQRGRVRADAAYWHLFFKDRSTEGLNRDNYNGTYGSKADLLSLSFSYGF